MYFSQSITIYLGDLFFERRVSFIRLRKVNLFCSKHPNNLMFTLNNVMHISPQTFLCY